MDKNALLRSADQYVNSYHSRESTGHDYWHVKRVEGFSVKIAEKENANVFITRMAALLHDLDDYKAGGNEETLPVARKFLEEAGSDRELTEEILRIIRWVSFRGAGVDTQPESQEAQILQDADRLDAIGAIGIARTFAYGGKKQRPIYEPEIQPVHHTSYEAYKHNSSPTINHFYEKLLLLKKRMNTQTAFDMAEKRHQFLEYFLDNFYEEWREALQK